MFRSKKTMALILGVLGLVSVEADASLFTNFRYAMGYLGFQQQLSRNLLGDGWTYNFSQNFLDKEYDFGNAEVTLNGFLKGTVDITNRGIPEVEFDLNTPLGSPITYDFLATDGPHKLTVTNGTFGIQQKIILNAWGGYDIQLRVQNRGLLVSDDPNAEAVPLDYDIGPIDVHGQWLVDLVNLTLGKALGFTLPGGSIDQVMAAFNQAIGDGFTQAINEMNNQITNQDLSLPLPLEPAMAPAGFTLVPEPATLALLTLGSGLVLRRRR
jgi:hypothetical protein